MRIGLFGGSFDPIHIAHLIIAQEAQWQLALDRLLLVPTARPPHKTLRRLTPIADRLHMVKLAALELPGLDVLEIEAGEGTAYTIDTLRHARRTLGPSAQLFLILGGDSLAELASWKDPDEICALATVAVYRRPGIGTEGVPFPHVTIDGPLLEVSASEIRRRMATGLPVRAWLPDPVRRFAEERSLYAGEERAC